jgi:hypothetical protein
MATFVRTNHATVAAAVAAEQVKTLIIFSGIGLLLSLLAAIDGLDPALAALF